MAIPRKKTLGFSEEAELAEPTTSEVTEVSTFVEALPQVEITPEPEPEPEPEPTPEPLAPVLLPPPVPVQPIQPVQPVKAVKRHPRNIPKFAVWK